MEPHLLEWLNLGLRWLHIITGIAWIGTSFFFMWLDAQLEPSPRAADGVEGEAWLIHSGGFYQIEKMQLSPDRLPKTLHWFKWEAYFTWISGFLLLAVVYYLTDGVFLVDPAVAALGNGEAIAIGLASLAGSLVVYEVIWRSAFGKAGCWAPVIVSFALLVVLAWALSEVFSGRGAYVHVGAVLGTIMVANVFFGVIPSQKDLVAASKAGRMPDPRLGEAAKARSVHNNYMTLPVVFIMISNHFPSTYGHEWNWIVLIVLFLVGAGIRHIFNLRNVGKSEVWIVPISIAVVAGLVSLTGPAPVSNAQLASAGPVHFKDIHVVIQARCATCHSAQPSDRAFRQAPKNVLFDTAEQIRQQAQQIKLVAVNNRSMPLGNRTRMTAEERALLARWIATGAQIN